MIAARCLMVTLLHTSKAFWPCATAASRSADVERGTLHNTAPVLGLTTSTVARPVIGTNSPLIKFVRVGTDITLVDERKYAIYFKMLDDEGFKVIAKRYFGPPQFYTLGKKKCKVYTKFPRCCVSL
jgi:hypothetical protein